MTDEAPLQQSEYGLVAADGGWFTVNVRDAAWMTSEAFGDACIFEGGPVDFGQIGYTLAVLQPGQPNGLYHREDDQEDFLVLSGECLAIIEGQERTLKAWDFVHCPPGTQHIFVGAGDGPCVIFMAGAPRPPRQPGLHARRDRARARRRRRDRDAGPQGGLRAVPEVAQGAAGEHADLALLAGRVALALAHDDALVLDEVLDARQCPASPASWSRCRCR